MIERQMRSGRFRSANEVVKAGLQLLEEDASRLDALRNRIDAADAAYAKGEYRTYDSADQLLADVKSTGASKSHRGS